MVFFNRFRRTSLKKSWIRIELAGGGHIKIYGKNLTDMLKQLLGFFGSLKGQIALHSAVSEPIEVELILSLLEANNIDLSTLE